MKLLAAASHRKDLGDSGNSQEPLTDHPVRLSSKFHRIRLAVSAPHTKDEDLPHNGRNRTQLWFDSRRHFVANSRQSFVHNLAVNIDVAAEAKFDIDHGKADSRCASNSLNTLSAIKSRLKRKRYASFHFLRCKTRSFGHDHDARSIEVRKDIDRHLESCPGAIAKQKYCDSNRQQSLV